MTPYNRTHIRNAMPKSELEEQKMYLIIGIFFMSDNVSPLEWRVIASCKCSSSICTSL
jgi:hypothetical protein